MLNPTHNWGPNTEFDLEFIQGKNLSTFNAPTFHYGHEGRITLGSFCYIVKILKCHIYEDGRADVTMIPIEKVIVENVNREEPDNLFWIKGRVVGDDLGVGELQGEVLTKFARGLVERLGVTLDQARGMARGMLEGNAEGSLQALLGMHEEGEEEEEEYVPSDDEEEEGEN